MYQAQSDFVKFEYLAKEVQVLKTEHKDNFGKFYFHSKHLAKLFQKQQKGKLYVQKTFFQQERKAFQKVEKTSSEFGIRYTRRKLNCYNSLSQWVCVKQHCTVPMGQHITKFNF
jgi:hypothetical protein